MNYRISGKYGKTAPRTRKASRSGDARTITTDLLLCRIGDSLCESAVESHRADHRRIAGRAATAIRLREVVSDLKYRLAQARLARAQVLSPVM